MSKKKRSTKPTRLSASQTESPAPLPLDEAAARRERIEAETGERQGHQFLAEGARLLTLRRPGEAAVLLEQAAALLPGNVDVAINLGGAYILQNRYSKAVPILEEASMSAPDNAMVWVNLAAAYLGRLELSGPKRQNQAIDAYRTALRIDATTPNVHYNLGLIYKDRRDWQQAQAYFAQALQVNPNDRDARYWLERLPALQQEAMQSTDVLAVTSLDPLPDSDDPLDIAPED